MNSTQKKSPIKVALMSGLVFPGLGYIYIQRFKTGIAVMLATAVMIGVLINQVLNIANVILADLQGTPSIPDPFALLELVHKTKEEHSTMMHEALYYVLPILWIGSTIHGYLIAKKQSPVDTVLQQ